MLSHSLEHLHGEVGYSYKEDGKYGIRLCGEGRVSLPSRDDQLVALTALEGMPLTCKKTKGLAFA